MPASAVPQRIFTPGAKGFENVQTYRNAVGDPEAMKTLEGYAVDRLRTSAMRPDGTLDPNRVQSFRRTFKDALRAFPELDARLADAETASRAMGEVAARRKATVDAAQKGTLGRIMGLDHPEDVTRAIGSVLGRQDSMQQMSSLRNAIGQNKEAQAGLRKSIADYVTNRFVGNTEAATTGQGTIKSDQFQTFIRHNRNALRAAGFSKDEVDLMDRIAQDLQRANRSIAGVRIPGGSNTAQDTIAAGDRNMSNFGRLLSVVGAGAGAALSGPLASMAGVMGGQTVSAMRRAGLETVDDLVADALLHPSVARMLLSKAPYRPDQGIWKVLGAHYGSAARAAATMGAARQADQYQRSTKTGGNSR